MTEKAHSGPLDGLRVIELAGMGPVPFCGMILADLGADVVRVDRPDAVDNPDWPLLNPVTDRGRRSVAVDLKSPGGPEVVLTLVDRADVLIEGFRPGVAERLGVGPAICLARRPGLVYGRITGWGQTGPYAQRSGHDLNYIAVSGVLAAIGPGDGPPIPPLNLVGDYGGGAVLFSVGILAALIQSRVSGQGQVVDAAMCEGSALLMAMMFGMHAMGSWSLAREGNLIDGAAPFYRVYETSDSRYVSIACLEPKFYSELVDSLDLGSEPAFADQMDRSRWPEMRRILTQTFRGRSQAAWEQTFAGTDVCFAPVLDLLDSPIHPHNAERGSFVTIAGVVQPGPAPRFSRTLAPAPRPASNPGHDTRATLLDWGIPTDVLDDLLAARVVVQAMDCQGPPR